MDQGSAESSKNAAITVKADDSGVEPPVSLFDIVMRTDTPHGCPAYAEGFNLYGYTVQ